jgi:capsular exopolysaccharide synthesis family protein
MNERQDDGPDIKKIVFLLLRQWHIIFLFGAFGLLGSYSFYKMTNPVYSVSSSVLIPSESKGMDMKGLFQGEITQSNIQIFNQIEVIKSSMTIFRTLENLKWRTSWSKKNMLVWGGIYKQEPFEVMETPGYVNPANIRVYITPTSGSNYKIAVDGILIYNGVTSDVDFVADGVFGVPFQNSYFHLTLNKKSGYPDKPSGKYYFLFNNLKDMALDYQSRLDAKLKDERSNIALLTITGEEPERESDFLNELVNVYIDRKMTFQNEAQRQSLKFINSQLAGITDSLNTAGNKFTQFRSNNNIIDLSAEGTLVMSNLKDIEGERAKSQVQLDYFRNLLSYLEKADQLDKLVSPSVVGIQDVSLNALVLKLGELYSRRQILTFTAKGNNPTLILLDKELTETRNRLTENVRNLIDNTTNSINSLKERMEGISTQLNKLPGKEQKMVQIQRQYALTNEIYTFLLQKRAETNIALASSTSNVQVIEEASSDTAIPVSLPLNKILLIGFILGLGFPIGFIMLINFFDKRIRTQEEVEKGTRLPILGHIMHKSEASDLSVYTLPKSIIAESFRDLRTNLEFMLGASNEKVISIHSTTSGEGKSFSATNLATILAMNDKKVLLIGADLRKPKLHKIFNVSNHNGLSTCLIGYDTFEQVIVKTGIENLSLLPAGPIPPNPAEILSKPIMKTIIQRAKELFDFIIIDNAPVAMVTDGFIMGQHSDLNIFILRYGVSHKHHLEMINQISASKKVKNVGIVVNDIKANTFGNTYYKYYQYEAHKNTYYAEEEQEDKTWKSKLKDKVRNKKSS